MTTAQRDGGGSLRAFADEAYPLDATDKDQTAQALILGAIFDVPLAQPSAPLGLAFCNTRVFS
jgi:hypothetical protein